MPSQPSHHRHHNDGYEFWSLPRLPPLSTTIGAPSTTKSLTTTRTALTAAAVHATVAMTAEKDIATAAESTVDNAVSLRIVVIAVSTVQRATVPENEKQGHTGEGGKFRRPVSTVLHYPLN